MCDLSNFRDFKIVSALCIGTGRAFHKAEPDIEKANLYGAPMYLTACAIFEKLAAGSCITTYFGRHLEFYYLYIHCNYFLSIPLPLA